MFPQEKSKGSRFVFPEGGGDVCTQATTSRLIRHGHFKTNLHKTCCNQIQQGHRTENFEKKTSRQQQKKAWIKMAEAILNILGDCREKFICSSLPARLTEGWRGHQPAPVTAKNTSPIDVVLFAWSTGRGETGSATIVLRLARPLSSQTSSKISPEIILSFSSAINLQCLRNGQKWAVVSNTCSSSSMCSSG